MSPDPQPRPFLTAEWRMLAMLNYEISPEILAAYVPSGAELDHWNGRCLVSMVGFRFLDTRVLGVGVPFHRDFEEVNLRFYVRRKANDEWRRGVVFVQELVPRRMIAWVARKLYNENYRALPMRHSIEMPAPTGAGSVRYQWQHQARWDGLSVDFSGEPLEVAPGSEEEFITEHYWGYVRQRNGQTLEYQVEHPRWRAWRGTNAMFEADVATLYGPQFREALSAAPTSAFVAEGSPVTVYRGRAL